MSHVLIVEDERDTAQLLELSLGGAGFDTRMATSGAEAIRLAGEAPPLLVLLDVMLPDMSGLEVCRQLKALPGTRDVPVLMLSAHSAEPDRVAGLEAGADDYVAKPFSVRELLLRLKVVLGRSARASVDAPPTLGLGILRIELASHRCFVADEEVPVTALEFRLLHHLLLHVGRAQTRRRLLREVWGVSGELETRRVDTHVMRLREKLGNARRYLETVRGVGYRLVSPPPLPSRESRMPPATKSSSESDDWENQEGLPPGRGGASGRKS